MKIAKPRVASALSTGQGYCGAFSERTHAYMDSKSGSKLLICLRRIRRRGGELHHACAAGESGEKIMRR